MALTKITAKQITFKLGAVGAVIRSLLDRLSDSVTVKDFGAKGDGTDATAAFKTAMNALPASGGVIKVPAGVYVLTEQLVNTNKSIVFKGAGQDVTVLRWASGTTAGIKHVSSTSNDFQLTVKDISLEAGYATGAAAIDADFTMATTPLSRVTAVIENVTIQSNGVGTWAKGVVLTEGRESLIRNVRVKGTGRASMSHGIQLKSGQNSTNYFIDACLVQSVARGIEVSASVTTGPEGVHVNQTTLIDCDFGIHWDTVGSEPLLMVTACHFDCMNTSIHAFKVMQFVIADNHIQKGSGSTVGNTGIYLTGTSEGQVSGNIFLGNTGTGDYNAIVVENSSYINIHGNVFRDMTTAVWFKSTATNCSSRINVMRGVTNPLFDQGTTNLPTVNAAHATNGFVVDETGIITQWGTAVISTDANGEGTISLPRAFPNGYLSGVVNLGDNGANGESAHIKHASGTTTQFTVRCTPSPGTGVGRRINFVIIGR